jgi:hypothetical protein
MGPWQRQKGLIHHLFLQQGITEILLDLRGFA